MRSVKCFFVAMALLLALTSLASAALAAPESTEIPVTLPVMAEIVNCAEAANVRSKADSSSARLGTIPLGGTSKVTAVNGDWYQIQFTETQRGYVHKDYVKLVNPDTGAVLETAFATETPVSTPTAEPTAEPTPTSTPEPEPSETEAVPTATPSTAPLVTKDAGRGGNAFLLIGAGVLGTLAVEAIAALILFRIKKRR